MLERPFDRENWSGDIESRLIARMELNPHSCDLFELYYEQAGKRGIKSELMRIHGEAAVKHSCWLKR